MVTPCLCHLRSYDNWHPHHVAVGCRLSNGEGRAVGTPEEGGACCQEDSPQKKIPKCHPSRAI